jgi:hypothetical protein
MDLDDRAEQAAESGGSSPEAAREGEGTLPASVPASTTTTEGEPKTGSLPARPATSP